MSTTIIAGTRTIRLSDATLSDIIAASGLHITEVISGLADGPDTAGKLWAEKRGIKVAEFKANWDDLSHEDRIVRYTRYGKPYDARAGNRRNEKMAAHAAASGDGALLAIYDGKSSGTADMISLASNYGLRVYVHLIHGKRKVEAQQCLI